MPLPLIQSQVIELLMRLHDLNNDRQPAILSRLQHLKRLGFPEGVNTGKGNRAKYGVYQLLQTLMAFELLQLGLTPERVVSLIRLAGWDMVSALSKGMEGVPDDGHLEHVVAIISPDALHGGDAADIRGLVFSLRSIYLKLIENGATQRRLASVDVTQTLIDVGGVLDRLGYVGIDDFAAAIDEWADSSLTRLPNASHSKA